METIPSDKQLKLIALVLPEPLYAFVRAEQNYIAETWGCRQSLRTPPHITLIPPISISTEESLQLGKIAADVASKNLKFEIKVNGYDAFPPKVIFIKPNFPKELHLLYMSLRGSILSVLNNVLDRYPDESFHPHITIAYRDVDPQQFKEMWKYYRNKKVKMYTTIDSFCILQNVGGEWVVEKEFGLSAGNATNEMQSMIR